jgi:hypothetical protein
MAGNKIFDKIKGLLKREKSYGVRQHVGVGAIAKQSQADSYYINQPYTFVGRQNREYHNIDFTNYQSYPSQTLIRILEDIDPDLSSAIWMLLRVGNSGHRVIGKKTNGKPSKEAQKVIDDLTLKFNYSGIYDGFTENRNIYSTTNELFLSGYTRGAVCGMLVLDNKFKPEAIQTIDPNTIDFKKVGTQYKPYQVLATPDPVLLDYANFLYVPIDPEIGDPYGRCPITSFLSVVFFRIGVLKDLQKVVRNQGWPRIKIKVLEETIINNAPPNIKRDPNKLATYISDRMDEIKTMYETLEPDSSIVFLDSSEPSYLESEHSATLNVDTLIEVLNSLILNALKATKTAIGKALGPGASEGYTSAEMTMYVKSLQGFQNVVKTFYDRLFTLALHLSGVQGYAEWVWTPIELRSPKEMAQFEQVHIDNTMRLVAEGYISDEEASIILTGSGPTGKPRQLMTGKGAADVERPATSESGKETKRNDGRRQRRRAGDTSN